MIAVIFEVEPAEGEMEHYLTHAASLKPVLEQHPGFLTVERFQSLTDPNKLLSLSFFEDEAAITQWRKQNNHRDTQSKGRSDIFKDYRLRVAAVQRDYGLHDREQAPRDSRDLHG